MVLSLWLPLLRLRYSAQPFRSDHGNVYRACENIGPSILSVTGYSGTSALLAIVILLQSPLLCPILAVLVSLNLNATRWGPIVVFSLNRIEPALLFTNLAITLSNPVQRVPLRWAGGGKSLVSINAAHRIPVKSLSLLADLGLGPIVRHSGAMLTKTAFFSFSIVLASIGHISFSSANCPPLTKGPWFYKAPYAQVEISVASRLHPTTHGYTSKPSHSTPI